MKAQAGARGGKASVLQHGGQRGVDPFLRHIVFGGVFNVVLCRADFSARNVVHFQFGQMVKDVLFFLFLTAPPRGDAGQDQVLAVEVAADPVDERAQGGDFRQSRSQRVDQRDVAFAHDVRQSGDAEHGRSVQFQRVAQTVVNAAQNHVNGFQPVDVFQIYAVAAHRQIGGVDRADAQTAGEKGFLERQFLFDRRAEQHDQRDARSVRRRGAGEQVVAHGLKEIIDARGGGRSVNVGHDARQNQTVFNGQSDAFGRLRLVRDDPESAVGRAFHVGGVFAQKHAVGRTRRFQRGQVGGIAEHDSRRDHAVCDQPLFAVQVAQDVVE